MDTSNQEEIEAKIFLNIVENGPISIYAASNKKDPQNPPFTTVHRHFKKFETEKLITISKKYFGSFFPKIIIPTSGSNSSGTSFQSSAFLRNSIHFLKYLRICPVLFLKSLRIMINKLEKLPEFPELTSKDLESKKRVMTNQV